MKLAAVSALDGYTYVIKHKKIQEDTVVFGPSLLKKYPLPELICKLETGPGISSPIITSDRLVVCSYNGTFLYSYKNEVLTLLDKFGIAVEASPVIIGNRIYIASRNGYFYCLGEKEEN